MRELNEQDQKDWQLYIDRVFNGPTPEPLPIIERHSPSRRLDLHGMTVGEAHGRTDSFLAEHHEAGTESVVIITGKSGQIAHEFTEWLRRNARVRRYEPMVDSKGGVGSYRIWLRR